MIFDITLWQHFPFDFFFFTFAEILCIWVGKKFQHRMQKWAKICGSETSKKIRNKFKWMAKWKMLKRFFKSARTRPVLRTYFIFSIASKTIRILREILTEPPQSSGFLAPRVPTFVYNKNNNNRSEAKSRTFCLCGREHSALSNGYLLFVFSRIAGAWVPIPSTRNRQRNRLYNVNVSLDFVYHSQHPASFTNSSETWKRTRFNPTGESMGWDWGGGCWFARCYWLRVQIANEIIWNLWAMSILPLPS